MKQAIIAACVLVAFVSGYLLGCSTSQDHNTVSVSTPALGENFTKAKYLLIYPDFSMDAYGKSETGPEVVMIKDKKEAHDWMDAHGLLPKASN